MTLRTDTTIQIRAPGKINLGLRIGDKRDDGFHEIKTIFQTVSLADTLEISFPQELETDELEIDGPEKFPVESDNLVFQALMEIRREGISIPPAEVTLRKQIPPGAGLGGGSSDAAAILQAIRELDEYTISDQQLHSLARDIGADVPFFLCGGTMLGEGIGDNLSPMDDFQAYVILAIPDEGITTEWAYDQFDEYFGENQNCYKIKNTVKNNLTNGNWEALEFTNDFEPLIDDTIDSHRDLCSSLEDFTDSVGVSGSGSAVYGLFRSKGKAVRVFRKLKERFPDVDFFHEQFVPSNQIPWFD